MKKYLFLALAILAVFVPPAPALFLGIAFAVIIGAEFKFDVSGTASRLLKVAVVGIGFSMNIIESLRSSYEGMIFTIFSVTLVITAGIFVGKKMGIARRTRYLIAAGTAICGGSAIAAISPVIRAKQNEISISLAVIFVLNAIAMITFPSIGHWLNLSESDFGMWAAIAIHDTSAVVGAAKVYGEEALQIATTVKMSRALWIIPLSFFSVWLFRKHNGEDTTNKVSIPWFILLFVLAMIVNTYFPLNETLSHLIQKCSHKLLSLTLFLIGTTLSLKNIKDAGSKPISLGVVLWILISVTSLAIIMI